MANKARPKERPIPGYKKVRGDRYMLLGLAIMPNGQSFDLSEDVEPAMRACQEMQGIADALGLLEAMSEGRRTVGFAKAVYVMSVDGDPITKIGISANPIKRHADLQAAHYRELKLHGIVFCPRHNAFAIEQEVLQRSRAEGNGLMGEWLNEEPEDVLRIVFEVARDGDYPVCDGALWFKNEVEKAKSFARQRIAPRSSQAQFRATMREIRNLRRL